MPALYDIQFKPAVEKDLRSLTRSSLERVLACIERLREEPFPRQTSKLAGTERLYRLRVGDYRIVYEVDTDAGWIMVHYVRHRREVYRKV